MSLHLTKYHIVGNHVTTQIEKHMYSLTIAVSNLIICFVNLAKSNLEHGFVSNSVIQLSVGG